MVLSRALAMRSVLVQGRRFNHKCFHALPPARWVHPMETMVMFMVSTTVICAYPFWFMCNLDKFRPRIEFNISDEVKEQIMEMRAQRAAEAAAK